jgi:hypothetical protein
MLHRVPCTRPAHPNSREAGNGTNGIELQLRKVVVKIGCLVVVVGRTLAVVRVVEVLLPVYSVRVVREGSAEVVVVCCPVFVVVLVANTNDEGSVVGVTEMVSMSCSSVGSLIVVGGMEVMPAVVICSFTLVLFFVVLARVLVTKCVEAVLVLLQFVTLVELISIALVAWKCPAFAAMLLLRVAKLELFEVTTEVV